MSTNRQKYSLCRFCALLKYFMLILICFVQMQKNTVNSQQQKKKFWKSALKRKNKETSLVFKNMCWCNICFLLIGSRAGTRGFFLLDTICTAIHAVRTDKVHIVMQQKYYGSVLKATAILYHEPNNFHILYLQRSEAPLYRHKVCRNDHFCGKKGRISTQAEIHILNKKL